MSNKYNSKHFKFISTGLIKHAKTTISFFLKQILIRFEHMHIVRIDKLSPKSRFYIKRSFNYLFKLTVNKISNNKKRPQIVIPYYIDSLSNKNNSKQKIVTIAIHIQIYRNSISNGIIYYLSNIPTNFDLYVSSENSFDHEAFKRMLTTSIPLLKSYYFGNDQSKDESLLPLFLKFGKQLSKYDFVGHFYTENIANDEKIDIQENYKFLLGNKKDGPERISHIFGLLNEEAKVIFSESPILRYTRDIEFNDITTIIKKLIPYYNTHDIDNFPILNQPKCPMFWTRGEIVDSIYNSNIELSRLFNIAKENYSRQYSIIISLMILLSKDCKGNYYLLQDNRLNQDYLYYESQKDYSKIIKKDTVALSYYLPQFHATPENDKWHGKGFTEWTKVRGTNPLFFGHYQQHTPHSDLGYYLINSPDVLRFQASLMKKAGVFGQIFYHYWFDGKLILDTPSKMLLENKDIAMPFCFCWANENWTKKWDGNENEILLKQNYSSADAKKFIHYLFPFFKDQRYITIDNKPVLFIYRPSSIPNPKKYIEIWNYESKKAGIPSPFIVAVLTRGATNPSDYFMHAGVERVLHDWTNGNVKERKNKLIQYHDIKGSVLEYDDVADYYKSKPSSHDYLYFRSIIPSWDNTPRYGKDGYIVNQSTPHTFQSWLEALIEYNSSHLPQGKRFIVINAWNEWAEGAHLEPDSRFGYAYLNSIGRALSRTAVNEEPVEPKNQIRNTRIQFNINADVIRSIEEQSWIVQPFFKNMNCSKIFDNYEVYVTEPKLFNNLKNVKMHTDELINYTVTINAPCYVLPDTISDMIKFSARINHSPIGSNDYNSGPTINETGNTSNYENTCIIVSSSYPSQNNKPPIKVLNSAHTFPFGMDTVPLKYQPKVTTIIRFHSKADFKLLNNALHSVAAMKDCIVQPFIAAQDLDDQQLSILHKISNNYPSKNGITPIIKQFHSNSDNTDLRSKMLNESLLEVQTQFAAFLDYDDLLMPHAYSWLLSRLNITNKAVSFGRIYATRYEYKTGNYLRRNKNFEYGYCYEDFIEKNHAPINSFLIDTSKLKFNNIKYIETQKYYEDYYLTLQLFDVNNCDWESLKYNLYIGDYIHSIDRNQTLATINGNILFELLRNPHHFYCTRRIKKLKLELRINKTKPYKERIANLLKKLVTFKNSAPR